MLNTEIFTEIKIAGCEAYSISNKGNVKVYYANGKEKTLKFKKIYSRSGKFYNFVKLRKYGKIKNYSIARLVASHFICEKPGASYVVDHISGDQLNNNVENLQWLTYSENTQKALAKPFIATNIKTKHTIFCITTKIGSRETGISQNVIGKLLKNKEYKKEFDWSFKYSDITAAEALSAKYK